MSRSISIYYRGPGACPDTNIEIRNPYYLLGTQEISMSFWRISKLKELGIDKLTELGVTDPVFFTGWDEIADLGREIELLHRNLQEIEFDPEIKARWLSHLVYCYQLLIGTAPKESTPIFTIG